MNDYICVEKKIIIKSLSDMRIYKILFFCTILCYQLSDLSAQARFEFGETSHDFGEVLEGSEATYEFSFKNTGNTPLIISNVKASCGCTTPFWTKDPVLTGKIREHHRYLQQ